jgi:hypothetical protein
MCKCIMIFYFNTTFFGRIVTAKLMTVNNDFQEIKVSGPLTSSISLLRTEASYWYDKRHLFDRG